MQPPPRRKIRNYCVKVGCKVRVNTAETSAVTPVPPLIGYHSTMGPVTLPLRRSTYTCVSMLSASIGAEKTPKPERLDRRKYFVAV